MDHLYISLNAVFPFLFYMVFGFAAVKKGVADIPFMNKLNQMIFKLFFPLMMFTSIYSDGETFRIDGRFIYICAGSVLLVLFISILIIPCLVKGNPQRGVLIQAIYRSNTILFAIPLTENLFGKEGAALASMVVAFLVPMYNIAAVVLLESYRGGKVKIAELLKKMITNPLIMGAVAALICNAFRFRISEVILKPVSQFSAMTTPLALFILGGTLRFSSVKKHLNYMVPTLLVKMIGLPALAIVASVFLKMNALERFVYFILFAAPIAVSSFSMAQNMGGDGELAGELVVFSTVSSVITLFLWIYLMKSLALI